MTAKAKLLTTFVARIHCLHESIFVGTNIQQLAELNVYIKENKT